MTLGILRALLVGAAALCVLVAAYCIHFQGFHFGSVGIFVAAFAICVLAADRTYDWFSKRSRSRIAAYSSAASLLMICAFVLAELMVRLNFDNRASVYPWMTGFGMVATVAWVALDLMLRGRLDTSDKWVKPTVAGLASMAMPASLWAAFTLPIMRAEHVTPADCALMAQALKEFSPEGITGGMRLEARAKCDWRSLGLPEPGRHQSDMIGEFYPWFSVEPPTYSLLRTRVALSVGQEWVMLGGGGQNCFYSRTLKGWRQDRCETSWIS